MTAAGVIYDIWTSYVSVYSVAMIALKCQKGLGIKTKLKCDNKNSFCQHTHLLRIIWNISQFKRILICYYQVGFLMPNLILLCVFRIMQMRWNVIRNHYRILLYLNLNWPLIPAHQNYIKRENNIPLPYSSVIHVWFCQLATLLSRGTRFCRYILI